MRRAKERPWPPGRGRGVEGLGSGRRRKSPLVSQRRRQLEWHDMVRVQQQAQ